MNEVICEIHQTAKVDFIVPAITLASNMYKKPVRIVIMSRLLFSFQKRLLEYFRDLNAKAQIYYLTNLGKWTLLFSPVFVKKLGSIFNLQNLKNFRVFSAKIGLNLRNLSLEFTVEALY